MDQTQEGFASQEDVESLHNENWAMRGTSGVARTQGGEDDPAHLVRTQVLPANRLGDARIRRTYSTHSSLRRVNERTLEATPETQIPTDSFGRFNYNLKRVLIGAPIATVQQEHERLTKVKALAVLSSYESKATELFATVLNSIPQPNHNQITTDSPFTS